MKFSIRRFINVLISVCFIESIFGTEIDPFNCSCLVCEEIEDHTSAFITEWYITDDDPELVLPLISSGEYGIVYFIL